MAPARLDAPAPSPAAAGASAGPTADTAAEAAARAAVVWAALSPVVAGGGAAAGRVRVSRDGGRSYPRSRERAWSALLPDQPAAVRVYSDDGTARCLTADLDVSRGGRAQVDRDVAVLLGLVARCGGRAFTDTSPSGGRHVYVPWAVPVEFAELRPVLYALASLLPSLDVAPGVNLLAGCIRPPGARHKSGGWQTLDTPLPQALAIAQAPNGPSVWSALFAELRPQLAAQRPPTTDPSLELPAGAAGAAGPKERQAHAAPAVRPGGPRPLRPAALTLAATGSYDPARYPSPSEARQSVLAAAAASGWTFADLLEQLEAGSWPGLWSFYARYRPQSRREALAGDWLAALSYATTPPSSAPPGARAAAAPTVSQAAPAATPSASGEADGRATPPDCAGTAVTPARPGLTAPPSAKPVPSHVHTSDTRGPQHTGGHPGPSPTATPPASAAAVAARPGWRRVTGNSGLPIDGHPFLRAWWTAVRLAERDRHRGRAGLSARLVLRALGNAGQKTGRHHLAFGVRSLALATGLSRTTVAATLRQLRDADDPLVTRLVSGRRLAGDLYELRIPTCYLEQARTRSWRAGRIEALLPCFRILGVSAALVYEQLDTHPQTSLDLADTALLSLRATQQALAELAAHGLASHDRTGWRRGPTSPTELARSLGADTLVAEQAARYRTERDAWRTRLGVHTTLQLTALLPVQPYPDEPQQVDPVERWRGRHQHPPPAPRFTVDDASVSTPNESRPSAAVELVLTMLGGSVLASPPTGTRR